MLINNSRREYNWIRPHSSLDYMAPAPESPGLEASSCRGARKRIKLTQEVDLALMVWVRRAISMSIRQIMKAKNIICTVPEVRKTEAVAQCLEGEISPIWPASILRRHRNVYYYLDEESSSSLTSERAAAKSSHRMEREWLS